jgi:hypothetical protein
MKRRGVAGAVALALLVGAGFVAWLARQTAAEKPSVSATARAYSITFPLEAGPPGDNPNGGATLIATTNLPDGTLVWSQAEGIGGPGGGGTCCPAVENGKIALRANNGACALPPGAPRGTGFIVTVTVRPEYRFGSSLAGPSPPKIQPASVQAVLGPRFERLTGPQVRIEDGVRQLVATARFDWPGDTCESVFTNNDLFLPEECPTTDTRGQPLAMVQSANARSLMKQLMPAIAQIRVCEIWRAWMTRTFRKANPWPSFRDRMKTWIDGLGNLAGSGLDQFTSLTWKLRIAEPGRYVADIVLRGRRVAEVEFVRLPFPKGCSTGCEPFWGFVRFDRY